MGLNNCVHEAIPDTGLPPSVKAIVDRGRRPVALRKIRPRNSRAQHPEDAVEHTPIIDTPERRAAYETCVRICPDG